MSQEHKKVLIVDTGSPLQNLIAAKLTDEPAAVRPATPEVQTRCTWPIGYCICKGEHTAMTDAVPRPEAERAGHRTWAEVKAESIAKEAAEPSAQPAGSAPTERERFEKWARRFNHSIKSVSSPNLAYADAATQRAWLAWQAARAAPANLDSVVEKAAKAIDSECAEYTSGLGLPLEKVRAIIRKAVEEVAR